MIKRLISFFILASTILSTSSYAGLISYNGYTLDEGSNIVTGGGLEWLQWDETDGQSITTALSTYSSSGWRLASNSEMASLFNAFNFGLEFDTDENTAQGTRRKWDVAEISTHLNFVSLFGHTNEEHPAAIGSDPMFYAGAHYGEQPNEPGLYNIAVVYDDYTNQVGGRSGAWASQSEAYYTPDLSIGALGVALVKNTSTLASVQSVPEPSVFAIFALGLIGIGLNRRRAQNR